VRQAGAVELGDALLDHGMPAVAAPISSASPPRAVTNAWKSQAVNSASCELGVGRTRRTTGRTVRAQRLSPTKPV
jgi:hypothetical protein